MFNNLAQNVRKKTAWTWEGVMGGGEEEEG